MLSFLIRLLKFILYIFMGFLWGYKYFCIEDVLKTLKSQLYLQKPIPFSYQLINRLKWVDYLFGLDGFESSLNDLLIKKILFFENMKHIDILESYYQVLCITLTEGQRVNYPSDFHSYIKGIQKKSNKIYYLLKQTNHANSKFINKLIACEKLCSQILVYWHVVYISEHSMSFNKRCQCLETLEGIYLLILKNIKTLNQSIWFKFIHEPHENLIQWLGLQHKSFLIVEQLKLKKQWIDPWLYINDQEYKFSIDNLYVLLSFNQNPSTQILKQWSEQWFNESKNLDWSDAIIFDDKVNGVIFNQWPLVQSFKDIFKSNESISIAWHKFERRFLNANLDNYHYLTLNFWQAKAYKYLCFMNEGRDSFTFLKTLPSNKKHSFLNDKIQYNDTAWSFQSDLTLVKHPISSLKTSSMINIFIHGRAYFEKHPDKLLWIYFVRNGGQDVFETCLRLSLSLKKDDINQIKSQLPSKFRKLYFDYVHQNMLDHGLKLQHFIWLVDESDYTKAIDERMLILLLDGLVHLDPQMLKHKSNKVLFHMHQKTIYKSWQRKSSSSFDKHMGWLRQLILEGFVTWPPLKVFIDQGIKAYDLKNTKLTLKHVKCMASLKRWLDTNLYVLDHINQFNQNVTETICKIIKESYQQRSLSHTLASEPLTLGLKQLIQPKDLPFIELMFKHYSCIDHWLDSMYLILFNALCQTNQPFLINPLIYWLYQTKIINIDDNQTCMLNQLFNVYQARKIHLLPSLQRYIDHMHTLCSTDEPCWDTLEIIVYKQRKEETYGNRAIQKEHRCGL